MSDVTVDTEPVDERRAGRPRNETITPSVLQAVRGLLAERGYAAMSMNAVAERAGTSVPALYRRWSSKVALVEDALFADEGSLPSNGHDLASGLAAWTRSFLLTSARPAARAGLPGLLAEYGHDAAQLARVLDGTESQVRRQFASMIEAAMAAGEAHPSCDVELMFELLRASATVRGILAGDDDVDAYAERLSAALLAVAAVPSPR